VLVIGSNNIFGSVTYSSTVLSIVLAAILIILLAAYLFMRNSRRKQEKKGQKFIDKHLKLVGQVKDTQTRYVNI
jgi:hypothetical protein